MDEAGRDKLWQQYSKTHDTELRDELILEYAQLVKLVAGRLSMYLGYNVEYDDLVGYGIFGLIDAIDKYDYGKNVKFETYASLRIRGAILDQIRKMDCKERECMRDLFGYQAKAKGAKEAQEVLGRVNSLFAGGELDEDAKDVFFQAIMSVYMDSKKTAREKYTPKKYRKHKDKE